MDFDDFACKKIFRIQIRLPSDAWQMYLSAEDYSELW